MRIVNVSADLNSQKRIRQQCVVNVEEKVKAEVHAAIQVDAEETMQKAPRKTKRVQSKEI